MIERNQVYNTDFMLAAPAITDQCVDAIITDPPYFILKDEEWDQQWKTADEYLTWFHRFLKESYRVLRENRTMFVFCSQYYMSDIDQIIRNLTDFQILNRCVWHYPDNMAMYSKKGFKLTWEPFFFLLKGNIDSWNRGESFHDLNTSYFMDVKIHGMCKSTSTGQNRRVHASQKPIELMEELVRVGSFADEWVLDPFAGSGTTLVACKRNARDYTGFEIRESYIPVINDRLSGRSGESVSPITAARQGTSRANPIETGSGSLFDL